MRLKRRLETSCPALRAILLSTLLFVLLGCALPPLGPRTGSLDAAITHLAKGRLLDAKKEAITVPQGDPDHDGAQKLLNEIDKASLRLAEKHTALAREYELSSMPSLALKEYKRAESMRLVSSPAKDVPAASSLRNSHGASTDEGVSAQSVERGSAELKFALGKTRFQQKQYRASIEELKLALRHDPGHAQAKELLEQVKKERDARVVAHLKKGLELFEQEDLDRAIGEWSRAIELDPDNSVALDYSERARVMQDTLRKIKRK